MPLIPLRPLLETVDKYHFAQGAFNVNAVAQAKAAIEVHEMFRSAAILQGADLANGFMGGRTDFQNATLEDKKIGAKNIADAVKKYAGHRFLLFFTWIMVRILIPVKQQLQAVIHLL